MMNVASKAPVVVVRVVRPSTCGVSSAGDVTLSVELDGPLSDQSEDAAKYSNIPNKKKHEHDDTRMTPE